MFLHRASPVTKLKSMSKPTIWFCGRLESRVRGGSRRLKPCTATVMINSWMKPTPIPISLIHEVLTNVNACWRREGEASAEPEFSNGLRIGRPPESESTCDCLGGFDSGTLSDAWRCSSSQLHWSGPKQGVGRTQRG